MVNLFAFRPHPQFDTRYALKFISMQILGGPDFTFTGTVGVDNTEVEYDALVWTDSRTKPTWLEITDAYDVYMVTYYNTFPITCLDYHTHIEGVIDSLITSKVDKITGKGLSTEDFSSVEKSKLSGIEAGATANSSDSHLLNRDNHTGSQSINSISGLQDAINSKMEYLGATGKAVKAFRGVTNSSGQVVFNLTSDGTSGGAATFSQIDAAVPSAYDGSGTAIQAPNAFNTSWTNSGKTLTVRLTKGTSTSVLIGGTISSAEFAGAGYTVEVIVVGTKA